MHYSFILCVWSFKTTKASFCDIKINRFSFWEENMDRTKIKTTSIKHASHDCMLTYMYIRNVYGHKSWKHSRNGLKKCCFWPFTRSKCDWISIGYEPKSDLDWQCEQIYLGYISLKYKYETINKSFLFYIKKIKPGLHNDRRSDIFILKGFSVILFIFAILIFVKQKILHKNTVLQ